MCANAPLLTQCTAAEISSLISLDISGCVEVADKSLVKLLANNTKLLSLNVSHLVKPTNKSYSLIGSCTNLRTLDISSSENIAEDTYLSIFSNCLNLRELYLAGCWDIGEYTLLELKNLSQLRILDLTLCQVIAEFVNFVDNIP